MEEKELNIYLVGPPESEYYERVDATSPQVAAGHWIADQGEDQPCEVWTRVVSYPCFDVRDWLEAESENNPETAPLEECWTKWQGGSRRTNLSSVS